MKPREPLAVDEALWRPADTPAQGGRGWTVFVEGLEVLTRVGIHPHEHGAPQPVVIDARLGYRCTPAEADASAWIDYEGYCERLTRFLETKPHTRLLETLAVELALLSFGDWRALDSVRFVLHKPKIRPGTQRIGVELDWTRADFDAYRRVTGGPVN